MVLSYQNIFKSTKSMIQTTLNRNPKYLYNYDAFRSLKQRQFIS